MKHTLFIFLFCLVIPVTLKAENLKDNTPNGQDFVKEYGFMTGFARGDLARTEDDYEIVPFILRFGYNLNVKGLGFTDLLKPAFDKFGIKPKGYTEFIFEPFVNSVVGPDSNIEAGFGIFLKYSYPLFERLHPYGIAGGGAVYMSQETHEQSTQYNFIPQVGAGISYFINDKCTFNVEYRYRHLSNADIKTPNRGINVNMILTGISWYY